MSLPPLNKTITRRLFSLFSIGATAAASIPQSPPTDLSTEYLHSQEQYLSPPQTLQSGPYNVLYDTTRFPPGTPLHLRQAITDRRREYRSFPEYALPQHCSFDIYGNPATNRTRQHRFYHKSLNLQDLRNRPIFYNLLLHKERTLSSEFQELTTLLQKD